jgi:hypothetical protein
MPEPTKVEETPLLTAEDEAILDEVNDTVAGAYLRAGYAADIILAAEGPAGA